jgi:hypothetical protein
MNPNERPLEQQLLTDRSIAIKLVGVGGAGVSARAPNEKNKINKNVFMVLYRRAY